MWTETSFSGNLLLMAYASSWKPMTGVKVLTMNLTAFAEAALLYRSRAPFSVQ